MKIVTPEELMGIEAPEIGWHHGTCDCCKNRLILICHFRYNKQSKGRNYCVCKDCLRKKAYLTLISDKEIDEIQKMTLCQTCNLNPTVYKCNTCKTLICSSCFRTHKCKSLPQDNLGQSI